MPFLRSFCMFAATGIFFLYVFGILFFVSCLAIDERRLQEKRDGCTCTVRRNWKPNKCSQRNIQKMVLETYIGPTMMKTPVKVCKLEVKLFNIKFLHNGKVVSYSLAQNKTHHNLTVLFVVDFDRRLVYIMLVCHLSCYCVVVLDV
jgi:hypothetical protein